MFSDQQTACASGNDGRITFSFGENWKAYLRGATRQDLEDAEKDVDHWLGRDAVAGKTVLDAGSGSGVHSLAFLSLGARSVVSFDVDPASVAATRQCWEQAGRPGNWTVLEGSVLDAPFLRMLGRFDVVYSWGVLHHTGNLWQAMDHAFSLAALGGRVWISIYTKGPRYGRHLALKRRFNAASRLGKWCMIRRRILRTMGVRLLRGQNPLTWNQRRPRGMNTYHDLVDWLGGMPYEVASADEVVLFARRRGFVLERINPVKEGGCSTYVFGRVSAARSLNSGHDRVNAA